MPFDVADTRDKVISLISVKASISEEAVRAAVRADDSFKTLALDSLDIIEIVIELEEQFSIKIDDEDAEKLSGIDEVVEYVHARRTK